MSDHRDLSEINPHLGLWASENASSPIERAWDAYYAKAEKMLGHDLDGDENENGYSIDAAFAAFEAGETAESYVAGVIVGENYKPRGDA